MDRVEWLKKVQHECENQYDNKWSLLYRDGKAGMYQNTMHLQFIHDLLKLLPHKSAILDAACGSGRYLPFLLEKDQHTVIGIDQSQGMLNNAKDKFPEVQFSKINLQDVSYSSIFDAVTCIDAMESIPPEDWPLVLRNFHQALKENGYLYYTVEAIEMTDENELKQLFMKSQQEGIPLIYGENPHEEVYHYHPTISKIQDWTKKSGFEIIQEGKDAGSYYHVLARKKVR